MKTLNEAREFLTIRKRIYNHFLDRMTDKVFRFYNWKFVPPTIWYTIDPKNCVQLDPVEQVLNLKLNEIPEEVKERFKDNMEIQEKILSMIKKRNEQYNYRCWLIRLTTWKWKSHVIMDIAHYYNTTTLVLVHNVKTLWEMVTKFSEFTNIKPAQYWGWKKQVGPITIMTKKSFSMDYDVIKEKFWLVLIDEAPIWFSKAFWNALNIFFDWKKWIALYWLSGTPEKNELETADLERYFWRLLQIKNQANNWYNIIPDFKFFDYHYSGRYEYENPAEMRTAISENMDRLDAQISEAQQLFKWRKCLLILTDRKLEVENFYDKRFWWTFVMTWDTKQDEDNQNLRSAEKLVKAWKKVVIIWTIQKVWVWVDIPFIDTIFLASAIKFRATVIQAIWRWLRKHKWKNDVLVWVWNDLPTLQWQRTEKIKTIEKEYLVNRKDIETVKIGKQNKIKF